MNTKRLLEYISNPQTLNQASLEEIQRLVQLFPYSQNIQLIYLFNLANTQDIRFGEQLQKTATYASDRRLLKKQIEDLKKPKIIILDKTELKVDPSVKKEAEPIIAEIVQLPEIEKEISIKVIDIEEDEIKSIPSPLKVEKFDYEKKSDIIAYDELINERNKIRSKAELLQKVKNRLSEIEAAQSDISIEKGTEKEEQTDDKMPLLNKLDLIDKFIRVEPSISRPEKIAFFDPDIAAQESLFDDGTFVTETLAKIYRDQGNLEKAKEIYQILSLNNPEKSSYFAALIQELDKNKIN